METFDGYAAPASLDTLVVLSTTCPPTKDMLLLQPYQPVVRHHCCGCSTHMSAVCKQCSTSNFETLGMLVLLHVLQVKDWEPKISSIVDWWVKNEAAQAQQLQH